MVTAAVAMNMVRTGMVIMAGTIAHTIVIIIIATMIGITTVITGHIVMSTADMTITPR